MMMVMECWCGEEVDGLDGWTALARGGARVGGALFPACTVSNQRGVADYDKPLTLTPAICLPARIQHATALNLGANTTTTRCS